MKTHSPCTTFPFQRLPLELRHMVYKELLPHNEHITFLPELFEAGTIAHRDTRPGYTVAYGLEVLSHGRGKDTQTFWTDILRVSKEVHAEARNVLYSQNEFFFCVARAPDVVWSFRNGPKAKQHYIIINPLTVLSPNVVKKMLKCNIEVHEEVFRQENYSAVERLMRDTVVAFGHSTLR